MPELVRSYTFLDLLDVGPNHEAVLNFITTLYSDDPKFKEYCNKKDLDLSSAEKILNHWDEVFGCEDCKGYKNNRFFERSLFDQKGREIACFPLKELEGFELNLPKVSEVDTKNRLDFDNGRTAIYEGFANTQHDFFGNFDPIFVSPDDMVIQLDLGEGFIDKFASNSGYEEFKEDVANVDEQCVYPQDPWTMSMDQLTSGMRRLYHDWIEDNCENVVFNKVTGILQEAADNYSCHDVTECTYLLLNIVKAAKKECRKSKLDPNDPETLNKKITEIVKDSVHTSVENAKRKELYREDYGYITIEESLCEIQKRCFNVLGLDKKQEQSILKGISR